jgi:molybdopterin synthase catalytic subunit
VAAILSTRVQQADFDLSGLQSELLQGHAEEGAIASFTGYVRNRKGGGEIEAMVLEHYPGMTEKCIQEILEQAAGRWPLLAAGVVHRVGSLRPGEQIVWVGVAAAHREAAFAACEFIMDYLKTGAPFWKKEVGSSGSQWVEARAGDLARARRWNTPRA